MLQLLKSIFAQDVLVIWCLLQQPNKVKYRKEAVNWLDPAEQCMQVRAEIKIKKENGKRIKVLGINGFSFILTEILQIFYMTAWNTVVCSNSRVTQS